MVIGYRNWYALSNASRLTHLVGRATSPSD